MQELGFGAILHYHIKEIPGYIAYWVIKPFNLARCQTPLCEGGSLTLDEEDAHLTLGFPRGLKPISRSVDKQSEFHFNDYVADRCGKSRYKMTAGDVAKLITEEVNGGPEFKRTFMVENAVIETPTDGNLKPKILHLIDDVDEIRNLNWCGYVLSVLETTYPTWERGETVYFRAFPLFIGEENNYCIIG